MKNKFEVPDLTIIYFTGDLATYDVMSVSGPEDEWGEGDKWVND